ncbi:hypothetical protein QSO_2616 [Clostridioides difficile P31]|nr:hypothetical protein QSC_2602 [Clostridioides difficile P23]EQJ78643.1 hypothetical protein QU5_2611 [Clostridioides difficile P45]EQK87093.1 hypothetical protein QSO_2616 [Clostridioides difficile P31]
MNLCLYIGDMIQIIIFIIQYSSKKEYVRRREYLNKKYLIKLIF